MAKINQPFTSQEKSGHEKSLSDMQKNARVENRAF